MANKRKRPPAGPEPKAERRKLIAFVATIIAIAAVCIRLLPHRRGPTYRPRRDPDIILITIDTLRADSVGYAGNTRVRTPFLDRMAAEGVAFMNAHSHNVITLPSHVNILTGLYPFQHGVRDNAGFVLDPKFLTVATRLRKIGYTTGAFVGAFPLDSRFGLNQGFDVYDDNYGKGETRQQFVVQERPARAVLESAKKWYESIQDHKRFLWIHLYDAHAPYKPPEPFATQFRDDPYLGEISAVDAALDEFVTPMLSGGRDTLVIITGDHGEGRGDHGELTHGLFCYEATLKIPLIVRESGVIEHRVENDYVRHIDIVPTILDRAGLVPDKQLLGNSLLKPLAARDTYFEALSGSLNRGWAPLTGVIHSGRKFIDLPIAELYDLPRDPHEQTNRVAEERRSVVAAKEILSSLASKVVVPSTRTVSKEESARLLSLGYISSGGTGELPSFKPEDDPKNLVNVDNDMHRVIEVYETGNLPHALELARDVVRAKPAMPAGRVLLAFVLEQSERSAEAIANLEELLLQGRASTETKIQLGLLYSESGRAGEAAKLLGPIAAEGTNPDAQLAYGIALADEGKPSEANAQFQNVLQRDANNAPALQNLGIVALREGNVGAARDYLLRALELNPKLPLALNTMGVVYARQNDFKRAVIAWQQAVDLDPHQYDALFNIGLVEGRAGHGPAAREALQRFVRTAPRERYAADIDEAKAALRELR